MDAAEDQPPDPIGEMTGDRPEAVEGRPPARPIRLPFDRGPEQIEDLRDHDHARHAVGTQGFEEEPRVAAPDVQDVGADAQRVDQPDRLLEEVAERKNRHDPVFERRDHVVDRPDRRQQVVVGDHHALRGPRRARGEDQVPDVLGPWTRPTVEGGGPIIGHRQVGVGDKLRDGRSGKRFEPDARRVRSVTPGPDDEPTRLGTAENPGDRVGAHPEIERDEDQAGAHRPEIDGRQGRLGRAPGHDPIAGSKAELLAESPRRQTAAPIQLGVRPGRSGAVLMPQPERGPIGEAPESCVEQVEERFHHLDRTTPAQPIRDRTGSTTSARAAITAREVRTVILRRWIGFELGPRSARCASGRARPRPSFRFERVYRGTSSVPSSVAAPRRSGSPRSTGWLLRSVQASTSESGGAASSSIGYSMKPTR